MTLRCARSSSWVIVADHADAPAPRPTWAARRGGAHRSRRSPQRSGDRPPAAARQALRHHPKPRSSDWALIIKPATCPRPRLTSNIFFSGLRPHLPRKRRSVGRIDDLGQRLHPAVGGGRGRRGDRLMTAVTDHGAMVHGGLGGRIPECVPCPTCRVGCA